MHQIDTSDGFTLVEMIVVVAVLGILMALALPQFMTIIKNGRLATETNDLTSDLAFARAESARRGKRVTLCVSSNGTSCGSGSAWAGGRIVFVDTSTAGVVDGTDEILRYNQSSATNKVVITASGFAVGATSTLNYLQFRPSGAIGADTGGEFKVCDERVGGFGRVITVLTTGRAGLNSSFASCP